jgi:WD40 repeat protein
MIQASRTFRIFVSSTFDDLKEERNALQKHVFPKLRELCLQHGCRFQAIDLRWGVSEEAAIDQQTMKICFEEIGRCQRVTPRPNFIVLLGDRYGWCPLPYEIPALEFEEIKTNIKDNESIELLNKWYQCDYNAVPPVYDLQPRKREYVESANWEPIERRLRSILLEAVKTMDLSEEAQSKYWASATEQEIRCGALKVDKASEHVFCFFRTIKNIPHDPSAKKYIDLDETGNIDSDARRKLVALKCCLKEKLPNNIFKYEAQWTKSAVSSDHLNQLCDDALRSLTQVIEREIAGLEETNPLDEEIDAHEAFGKERISAFTGREDILTAISDYIKGPSIYPYVIRGESGSGKTALMAKTVERVREGCPEAKVFCRYIGATPESSDGRSLLERLCNQIYNTFDFENQKQRKLAEIKKDDEDAKQRRQEVEREYEIPMDFQKLSPIFRSFLSKIPSQEKLILFIDALDQLSDTDHARNLTWLPSELPRNIRVIVSTLPGKCLSLLERMLPEKNLKELEPMPLAEGTDLLKSWLKAAGRTLQNNQMKEVLGKFTKSGLPFYLKLAFEEARRWKSYTPRVDLSPDIPGIIRDFFKRLSLPANHGKVLVSHSMGYLAAAKNGLTEDELLDILSLDKTVFKYFADRAHHEPTETKLPVVVWLRLYHELESYLTERTADGTIVLSFYHRQLLEVVDDIFFEDGVKQKRHSLLASYFDKQPLWQEGQGKRTPNVRKVSELPYQQTYGELWDAIEKTLCDLHFVEAKCIGGLTHQLLSDFSLVFDVLPEAQIENEERKRYQKRIKKYIKNLKAYSESAIDNLKIISSLQPWNEEIIREEIDKIIKYPSRLNRIKAFHKFVNSHSQFLINFSYLDGFCVQQAYNIANSGPVAEAAQKIIESKNVKSKMILCNELSRHPYTPLPAMLNVYKSKFGICSGIAISAYSKTALIAFSDRINGNGLLYMWDITTGEILQQFESDCINCVAMTIDGRIGISGGGQDQFSYNGEAIIWDLLEGKPLTVLEDDNLYDDDGDEFLYAKITSVALSWDGRYAAIGRNNGFLSVFDLKNNKCFSLLQDDGIYEPIILTITANGQVIAIQDGYKLSMWDIKSKNHLGNIERVSADLEVGGVTSLAATPEGKFLVTGHENGTITVWNLITKKRIQEIIHCGCSVISVDITHDGELVASGGEDSKVKIWSMITGNCLCDLVGHTDVVTSVALSVDGKYVIS